MVTKEMEASRAAEKLINTQYLEELDKKVKILDKERKDTQDGETKAVYMIGDHLGKRAIMDLHSTV